MNESGTTRHNYTCDFCGRAFTQEDSIVSCGHCRTLGTGGCQRLRCPHCGYERPAPARLPALIARVLGKGRKTE